MPQSKTDLANLALSIVGNDPASLTDVDTDTTKAGQLCKMFIDNARQSVLRSFIWNFAKKRVKLTLAAITNAANNGSGLVRITKASHGFSTGNIVGISGVVGTVEANGIWTITVIDANNFDLQLSTFANTYISGGYVSLSPGFDYTHYHAFPADYLRLVTVNPDGEADYLVEGKKIASDETTIEIIYIGDITDYTVIDPIAYQVMALHLAWLVCYSLTQSMQLKKQLKEDLKDAASKARHTDSVEDPLKYLKATAWLNARVEPTGYPRDPMTS